MKKTILFLAALAMMAAGCSQKDDLAVTNTDPNAISFNAYTSTAVTRGVVKTSTDVQSEGIGVFAFYQPAVRNAAIDFNSRKYATPDFMYNQAVTYSDPDWTYTPRKYWPNNDSDQVSFFAYAPYDEDKTWEDLGITTDASASKLTATFPIYTEKPAMQDVLWATPQLNKQKPSVTEGAVNNPITFSFEHILSKVALYVGVETDQAKGEAGKWNYDSTTITIDKVEFTNLASAVNYVGTITAGQVSASSFTPATTTQNIVLTKENGDFRDSIALISKSGYWQTAGFHDLLSYEDASCTTCGASQAPSEGLGNGYTNAFLFLAPQSFTADKEQVIITYTVATVDSANAANNSTITNTIATDLATVLETTKSAKDGKFVSGKAYTLKFLIGMNSVKLAATVGDWDDAIEDTIYVPANEEIPVQVVGENCTISNIRTDATGNVLFEVASDGAYFLVCGSEDGTTWLGDTLLVSGTDPVAGKCIKTGTASPYTFTYKPATNDAIMYLKVKAYTILPTTTDCTLQSIIEDDDKITFLIKDDGQKTTLTLKGNGTDTLHTTTSEEAGKYTESISDSVHTIVYYKKSSNEYTSITVTASASSSAKPADALSGKFSVSATKQVYFSKGNLYCDSTSNSQVFKFENNQYDFRQYPGLTNDSAVINGTVQANTPAKTYGSFRWAVNSGTLSNDITSALDTASSLIGTDADVFFINDSKTTPNSSFTVNGATGVWRALSGDEWRYLLNISDSTDFRQDANRFAKAKVNGVIGLIIFPDGYNGGTAISGVTGVAAVNTNDVAFPTDNVTDWSTMETAGCVFLPAAGRREGSDVTRVGTHGYYWASEAILVGGARGIRFREASIDSYYKGDRTDGYSVRLVCDAE